MNRRMSQFIAPLLLVLTLAACAAPQPEDASRPACPEEILMTPFGEEKDGGVGGTGNEEPTCE